MDTVDWAWGMRWVLGNLGLVESGLGRVFRAHRMGGSNGLKGIQKKLYALGRRCKL